MRIAHITNTIYQQGGGIAAVVANISRIQKKSGHEVEIWIFAINKVKSLRNISKGINGDLINEIKIITLKDLIYSIIMSLLNRTFPLKVELNSFDIIHRHGLWSPISILNFLVKKNDNNFFISPHGLLNQEAMRISRIKKNIFIKLIEKAAFKKCRAFIASTDFEKLEILKFKWMINKKIIIIPNGVDDIFFQSETKPANQKIVNKKKQFLYLGAIERIKGVDLLVKAAEQNSRILRKYGYSFLCIGDGNEVYKKEITDFIDEHNLHDIFKFQKGIYGMKRIDAYKESKFFISMSYSENFGITIAESLVLGVPVIVSSALPWRFLEDIKAGIIVNPECNSIKMGIISACKMSDKKYKEWSNNAAIFSKDKYRWDIIGKKLDEIYREKTYI